MGNLSSVAFKKNVNLNLCLEKLQEVNELRFDRCLRISMDGDGGISVQTPEDFNFAFWRISARKLEWKPFIGDIEYWLTDYIACYMIRNIYPGAKIANEGIDEKLDPDFDLKYPSPRDWIMGRANNLKTFMRPDDHAEMVLHAEELIDMYKQNTHPSYWRV